MNELRGMHVLVTRPHPAGRQLCALIERHGGAALIFPTIAFESVPASISTLSSPDWFIFSSPQAVVEGVPVIQRAGLDCSHISFAAVGEGTANRLAAALPVHPIYPETTWDSEGLLALPALQDVQNKQIVLVRGEGGRDLLETTLLARGAKVSSLIVYRRVMPKVDVGPVAQLFQSHAIQVVVVTSGDGLRYFKQLLEPVAWEAVRAVPLIVVNDRGKKLAEDLGFRRIWIAGKASSASILSCLIQQKDMLCPTKLSN
jgi:uroporphyrinogen-III synthase